MRNQIYYLLDFHNQCQIIIQNSEELTDKYCKYINLLLNEYFTEEEQMQLKLKNFDSNKLYEFAYTGGIENISFDNINPIILEDFFHKISVIDLKYFLRDDYFTNLNFIKIKK